MIQYFLLLAISSTALAQNSETIFVTSGTTSFAQEIFSTETPKIVSSTKSGKEQDPAAVVEFAGVMEGDFCGHDKVSLVQKRVDADGNDEMEQYFYIYKLHTYKNGGRSGINDGDGGGCYTSGSFSSYSRPSPFRMRVNFQTYVVSPPRARTWVIKFDLGSRNGTEFSPTYRLTYNQTTDRWVIK